MEQFFGGNKINTIDLNALGQHIFSQTKYKYYHYKSTINESIVIDDLASFTVFFLKKPKEASVSIKGFQDALQEGDVLQVENNKLYINVSGESISLLVAGITTKVTDESTISLTTYKDIYKVKKHWGYELWINGQHPGYALKQIFIKKGTKTSLQYHNFKQETNVLFNGNAKLHYKGNDNVENDKVTSKDIQTVALNPIQSIDVSPPVLHRLEALSDILLYEVSTPHLDDVIRVSDDANRPSGRISSEHAQKK